MTTIIDVARRAGVSPVTVSRVMNRAPNVNPETRARVEQAIAELGYLPSTVARSLRSKRTRSLALLLPDITNTFWTTVARGVEDTAQTFGYAVFVCNTDEDYQKQQRYLELAVSQRADGVLIAPCHNDAAALRVLRERGVPTVTVDRRIEGWDVDAVLGDSTGGARALVQHLIALGHRRIAVISGPATTSTAEDRVTGYREALVQAGMPVDDNLIRRGQFKAGAGEELARSLLAAENCPSAIFAANNAIALGAIDAILAGGRRIPQDVALVAFDDFADASHLFPFLTVAVQPAYEMGCAAARLLLERLAGAGPVQPAHIVLPCRLIVRHSCGSRLRAGGETLSLPLTVEVSEVEGSKVEGLKVDG